MKRRIPAKLQLAPLGRMAQNADETSSSNYNQSPSPANQKQSSVSQSGEESHEKIRQTEAKESASEDNSKRIVSHHVPPPKCTKSLEKEVKVLEKKEPLLTEIQADKVLSADATDSGKDANQLQLKYPSNKSKAFFTASLRPTLPPIIEARDTVTVSTIERESDQSVHDGSHDYNKIKRQSGKLRANATILCESFCVKKP